MMSYRRSRDIILSKGQYTFGFNLMTFAIAILEITFKQSSAVWKQFYKLSVAGTDKKARLKLKFFSCHNINMALLWLILKQPDDYYRDFTSARSQQPDSNRYSMVSERKSLTTNLRAVCIHVIYEMIHLNKNSSTPVQKTDLENSMHQSFATLSELLTVIMCIF